MINRVWPPSEWSMFCEDENKDVEGNFRDYRENDCLSDMHNNDIFEKTKQIRRPQLAICYKNHWLTNCIWYENTFSLNFFQDGTESWTTGLGHQPLFTILIKLLFDEAKHVEENVQLVTDMKVIRLQRRDFRSMQARLFELWDEYRSLSASGLLKAVSTF